MGLARGLLEGLLSPIVTPGTMPTSQALAADAWASAYHAYSGLAVAAPVFPAFPSSDVIAAQAGSGDFFDGFSHGLVAYWASTVWTGPGFVGKTVGMGPVTDLLLSLSLVSVRKISPAEVAQRLSEALHTYTMGLSVLVTSVTSGATTVVPIV